jgi:hypothetical protein
LAFQSSRGITPLLLGLTAVTLPHRRRASHPAAASDHRGSPAHLPTTPHTPTHATPIVTHDPPASACMHAVPRPSAPRTHTAASRAACRAAPAPSEMRDSLAGARLTCGRVGPPMYMAKKFSTGGVRVASATNSLKALHEDVFRCLREQPRECLHELLQLRTAPRSVIDCGDSPLRAESGERLSVARWRV